MYHEPVANDFSPLVIGNRFLGANNCWASGGNTETHTGAPDKFACRDGRFIGNRFTNGFLQVGAFEDNPAPFPARDNNLWNNTRDAGGNAHQLFAGAQIGTTFNQDNEAFVAAEELLPADVGLAAPDPLCPSGPQS
jgi:hypothetical protein